MEEQNENDIPKIKERSFKSEQERAEWRMKANREYKEQLEKDERFIEWAKDFNAYSVQQRIEDYARRKVRWYEWGGSYQQRQEREELEWQEQAFLLLKEIQQKKLFDLQCEWRAEKIKLPDITTTFDFLMWETDVFSCPFLEPVREEEADLYLQYLSSTDYEFIGYGMQWQDYQKIKAAYENENAEEHFPEWYSFANSRKGTGFYLLMPDIRGEKENFYISLYREHLKKNPPEKKSAKPAPTPLTKPPLNYARKGFMDWFIKTYETPETMEFYKVVQADSMKGGEMEEFVQDAIAVLSKADRQIAIPRSDDWREGLFGAANEYRRQRLAEAFPAAYEEYRLKVQNGIELPSAGIDILGALRQFEYQGRINEILEGRQLNGEPRDFNF